MKIAIIGKGGVGKSTITAMLAKSLSKDKEVLVIDGDESNLTLNKFLGIERGKEFINYIGGREGFKKLKRSEKLFKNKISLNDIKEYLTKKDNIYFLTIGKIHDFGEGCACPIGALLKELLNNLDFDGYTIIDTEAGLEHFGRGVEESCDLIILIVDPTLESLNFAEKVKDICQRLGKNYYFIINKADDETLKILLDRLDKDKILGVIKENKEIVRKCLLGEELEPVEEIEKIAHFITSNSKTIPSPNL
ncbi:ATP-binding protein [Methanocaldococcus infernus]